MLTAIELDDNAMIGTDEIGNEGTEWNLAAKFQTQQPAVAQPKPEPFFDLSRVCAQAARCRCSHAPSYKEHG